MTENVNDTKTPWIDPDDAPEWTEEAFARAEVRHGDKVLKPASGTLTRRGRPRSETPKQLISLRLDQDIVESFRATGPGWQRRINDALRKAI